MRSAMATGILLMWVTGAVCRADVIGVYESQANAATYDGVYQEPLRQWLSGAGHEVVIIGDEQAADPAVLARFPLVMVSSGYIVPKASAQGLARYVEQGGRLIWLDCPARCEDTRLRGALGLGPGVAYAPLSDCTLRPGDDPHPIAGGPLRSGALVGNWAPAALPEAHVLYEVQGTDPEGRSAKRPAVIFTNYGKGKGLCFNWAVWVNPDDDIISLLGAGLQYMLAESHPEPRAASAWCSVARARLHQPEYLRVMCRAYANAGPDAPRPMCEVRMLRQDGQTVGLPRRAWVRWSRAGQSMVAGKRRMRLRTRGLEDGTYVVRWRVSDGADLDAKGEITVQLDGQRHAASRRAALERRALLEPLLLGTLGDYDSEPRTPDERVDIPRLIEQIRTANMNMYDFLIWHKPTDWEDFQAFLPEAQKAGIKVWVTLCPPSEQGGNMPHSEPYRLDFIKWADEIGKLAARYDNFVAMVIDDFVSSGNARLFTPDYVQEMVATLRAHRPDMAFLPVVYSNTVGSTRWIEAYGPHIDGIVFPYREYVTGDRLQEQLEACRRWIGPERLLLTNVYASGSGGGAAPERTARYMRNTLTVSRHHSDGIRIYCLPKEKLLEDPRYAVTAELYGKWTQEGP